MLKVNFKRDFKCGIRKAYVLSGLISHHLRHDKSLLISHHEKQTLSRLQYNKNRKLLTFEHYHTKELEMWHLHQDGRRSGSGPPYNGCGSFTMPVCYMKQAQSSG